MKKLLNLTPIQPVGYTREEAENTIIDILRYTPDYLENHQNWEIVNIFLQDFHQYIFLTDEIDPVYRMDTIDKVKKIHEDNIDMDVELNELKVCNCSWKHTRFKYCPDTGKRIFKFKGN